MVFPAGVATQVTAEHLSAPHWSPLEWACWMGRSGSNEDKATNHRLECSC